MTTYSLTQRLASWLSLAFIPVIEADSFGSVYVTVYLRIFGWYYKTQLWAAAISSQGGKAPAHCLMVFGQSKDTAAIQTGRSLSFEPYRWNKN